MSRFENQGLFDYQQRALDAWSNAHERAICMVAPTGAGKSVMFREVTRYALELGWTVAIVAHRIELLIQAQSHMGSVGIHAGIIAQDYAPSPSRVQCCSLDTLSARGMSLEQFDLVIHDECHHTMAPTYLYLLRQAKRLLGLTATPERRDKRALGDIYERLIVAVTYSELLACGQLVRCRVFSPGVVLDDGLAWDPADAYERWGEGRQGFAFCRSVRDSQELAAELTRRGFPSKNVDGTMPDDERAAILAEFKRGELRMLCNVYLLTEGIDVPTAEVCLLASRPGSVSGYLQRVGRVLRRSPGKASAMLIDLFGASHPDAFGSPTIDREYALDGKAIRAKGESLKNCPKCFYTLPSSARVCDECHYEFPTRPWHGPKIHGIELREMFDVHGDFKRATKEQKLAEWLSRLDVEQSAYTSMQEFRDIFGEEPPVKSTPTEYRVRVLSRLHFVAHHTSKKTGWTKMQFKLVFGSFPSKDLQRAVGMPLSGSFRQRT